MSTHKTMNNKMIKECPLCGGESELILRGNGFSKKRKAEIKCTKCHLELVIGAVRNSLEWCEEKVIERWNNRSAQPLPAWIDVSERMPEHKQVVLVNCEHGVTMAEYTKFDNGNYMWWAVLIIGTYEDSGNAYNVTHWQPLPAPPTSQASKKLLKY